MSLAGQEKFEPLDFPYKLLKPMASAVTKAMMPDLEVHNISLAEEMDGDRVLACQSLSEACWIDPLEAMTRMAGLAKFGGKLYTQFEPAFKRESVLN
jgi:hypothetical protein